VRAGDPPEVRGQLLRWVAGAHDGKGDHAKAETLYKEQVVFLETLAADTFELADALLFLAELQSRRQAGRGDGACAAGDRDRREDLRRRASVDGGRAPHAGGDPDQQGRPGSRIPTDGNRRSRRPLPRTSVRESRQGG
jgi:hypothetical protein